MRAWIDGSIDGGKLRWSKTWMEGACVEGSKDEGKPDIGVYY